MHIESPNINICEVYQTTEKITIEIENKPHVLNRCEQKNRKGTSTYVIYASYSDISGTFGGDDGGEAAFEEFLKIDHLDIEVKFGKFTQSFCSKIT